MLLTDGTVPGGTDILGTIGQLVRLVAAFVIVLFLAYYITRFLGASGRLSRARGANIKVLEATSVGQAGSVQLVRVGQKVLLLGVTKEHISVLTEMTEDELDVSIYTPSPAPALPFDKVLGRLYKPRALKAEGEEAKDDEDVKG